MSRPRKPAPCLVFRNPAPRSATAATFAPRVSPSMEGDLRHFVDSLQVLALLNRRGLELVIQQVDHLLADHYARHPEDRPEAGTAETLDE